MEYAGNTCKQLEEQLRNQTMSIVYKSFSIGLIGIYSFAVAAFRKVGQ